MPRKAFTLRIDSDVQERLATLSRALSRPMNRLVNEALKSYLERRSLEVEKDLERSLTRLKAYRQRDPDFEKAIDAFVEAEAGHDDPVEGRLLEAGGPIRKEIDRLLNG